MNEIGAASGDGVPIVTVIQVLPVEGGNQVRAVQRVVHCAQWRSRSALEVTLGVPSARARMATIQRIADDDPHLYEWATFERD